MLIDFSEIIEPTDRIISGREFGYKTRQKLSLDTLDKEDLVQVKIPNRIWSMNSSFFVACFGPSIKKLGLELFRAKYKFICEDHILSNIEDGITTVLIKKGKHCLPFS